MYASTNSIAKGLQPVRVSQHGIERSGDSFSFSFDGELISACPGETIAAALTASGKMVCREARNGEQRGVFCGMGVCGECAVVVDGKARRACMEMAAPEIQVYRQPALRTFSSDTALQEANIENPETHASDEADPLKAWARREVEVLVIGAGPSGLAAARAAAQAGAEVLVVDERSKAGGQYFKQPGEGFEVNEARIDKQFREGRELFRATQAAGVEFLFGATVWGAFPEAEVAIATPAGNQLLSAQRIVVSPGAYERPMPFDGWTLPGVMTTGAAQTLLRANQTALGKRVLVAGNGPLNLQVARELTVAGVEVVAVVELATAWSLRNSKDVLHMLLTSPGLVMAGAGHLARLFWGRVPVHHQHVICAAKGEGRVEQVTIAKVNAEGLPKPGSEIEFEVDAVCLGYGFVSQSEIARALGAGPFKIEKARPPTVDRELLHSDERERELVGRSETAPRVFITGDARGLGGARVAMAQGALAGIAAARDLGYRGGAESDRTDARSRRDLLRHGRFQKALWSLYAAPDTTLTLASENTLVCRCEAVSRGDLEALFEEGVLSLGAIKRETRAGMGRCQGRYCAGLISEMARQAGFESGEEGRYFAPRPPFKPLSVVELASAFDEEASFNRSAGVEAP